MVPVGPFLCFADDQFCQPLAVFAGIGYFLAINEHHDIGILFNGTGLPKIRKLRPAMLAGPRFNGTAELGYGYEGYAELFCNPL